MKDQIKSRGWIWKISDEKTQWIAFKCMSCGSYATYPERFSDGHRCSTCEGGPTKPVGYVRKVREVPNEKD